MSLSLDKILCESLSGVGPQTAKKLHDLGLFTAQDLLFYLPLRYEDRTKITPIRSLRIGSRAVVIGKIVQTQIVKHKRSAFLCTISDDTGFLNLRFFYFQKLRLNYLLTSGTRVFCYGEVQLLKTGLEMVHPEFKILVSEALPLVSETYTAVYPTTEGLSQTQIRKLIAQVFRLIEHNSSLQELLPIEIIERLQLPNLFDSLKQLHYPPKETNLLFIELRTNPARKRLIIEELLAHQLAFLKLREKIRVHKASALSESSKFTAEFLKLLPFALTQAQQRVIGEIKHDLNQQVPMMRLLQGDVGSGKTVVAAFALLQAIAAGFQAAIMAPTEILAEQHFFNMNNWFNTLKINVVLVTGKIKGKERDECLKKILDGEAQLIVGTHALFQDKIKFNNLALVIIDEQHRFGVHQRLELRDKGVRGEIFPHQLIMTATPIPRTLAMTFYADLDFSIIDELPKGRSPISTYIVSNQRRNEIYLKVNTICAKGQQVYWVCPLVEESEILQCEAADKTAKELYANLPHLNIGLVHGRLQVAEKELVMNSFKEGNIDVLVATTVIEVGVDVPNATLMVIENVERFGLVQLHQLRGRIGRGKTPSYCILLYQEPLSKMAKNRLHVIKENLDGFIIANKDLELRGPGQVLGTKQTGLLKMHVADLVEDKRFLPEIQNLAVEIMHRYPSNIKLLINRWIGEDEKYIEV